LLNLHLPACSAVVGCKAAHPTDYVIDKIAPVRW
jgi:hypothetical protein